MEQVWDPRDPRLDVCTAVELRSLTGRRSVSGTSENISVTGLKLVAAAALEVGTPVRCRLPDTVGDADLRARVIWSQPRQAASEAVDIGLAFDDAPLRATTVGEIIGAANQALVEAQIVDLRLPGMASPVRARATLAERGFAIDAPLPCIARGAQVELCFVGDEQPTRSGRVQKATLLTEGRVPRLQLDVLLPDRIAFGMPGEALDAFEPPPRHASPDTMTVSGTIDCPDAPRLELLEPGAIDAHLPTLEIDSSDPLAADPQWTLEDSLDAPAPIAERPRQGRRDSRARRWVGLALLTIGGTALASAVTAPDLWRPLSERLSPRRAAAGLPPLDEIVPLLGDSTSLPNPELVPAPAPAMLEPPAPTVAARPKTKAPPASKMTEIQVRVDSGSASLRIPFDGRATRSQHYLLADPVGIAVNLPLATPQLRVGLYPVDREGFRAVWVRKRAEGTQVRVFFDPPTPPHDVRIEDGAIRVTIRRPQPGNAAHEPAPKPAVAAHKPAVAAPKPAATPPKPAAPTPKPAIAAPKPTPADYDHAEPDDDEATGTDDPSDADFLPAE